MRRTVGRNSRSVAGGHAVDLEVNLRDDRAMSNEEDSLDQVLASLSTAAHRLGLNDAQWAAKAGLPKETLSRLRRRSDCDFATLRALARAADARVDVVPLAVVRTTPDGHMPLRVDRDDESALLRLCASGERGAGAWRSLGPAYFMAGLAVMLASSNQDERTALLALGESLHPGSSNPEVFQKWLDRSPIRPSRFLPMLRESRRHAA
jgi:hypothetical protein